MVQKIGLSLIMGTILVAAAATSTPFPVLVAMGFLVMVALSASVRSQQE